MSSKVRNRRVPPQRHGQQPTKEEGVNNGISEDEEEDEDDLDELQDDDDGEEYQEYVPWYRQEEALPPFALTKHISSKDKNALPFRSLAMFPWDDASIELLWDGEKNSIDSDVLKWRKLISEWEGAVATASADKVYIFFLYSTRASVCISLPPDPEMKLNPVDTTNVAWAMSQSAPFEPLLIITRDRIVYIYNCVLHDMAGYLRGHGGTITSIAVHPTTPHIFCTTSRDFSTRVYDLTLTPTQTPNNPHWPPTTTPSLAGAAHGLHMTETEGSGVGRCVAVLMGGRSGGHQAAVLSAAFHPDMPLIATSGLDRNVKIWFVRPKRPDQIKREDKPLFSSGRIHRARVLSISWANHETLISHCAAAIMRKHPTDPNRKETYLHPGEIVVWRWLGFDRFFPARGSKEDWRKQETMRGCASDYQESSSFKVLSILSLPRVPNQFNTAFMRVLTARTHDPIALILEPGTPTVRVFNVALLPPRAPRPFPPDTARNEEEIPGAGLTTPTGGRDGLSMPEMTDPETEVRRVTRSRAAREPETVRWLRLERERMEQVAREAAFAPGVEGWRFSVAGSGDGAGNYGIHAAVMGMGARVIVAVGERKSLWVFELKDAPGRGVV